MDYVLQMLTAHFSEIVGGVSAIVLILIYLISKKVPDAKTSTMVAGLTDEFVKIIITILEGVKADYKGVNESLKCPVELPKDNGFGTETINKAKHMVAEQAIKELVPKKKLNKAIKILDGVSDVYSLVKKLYPLLRAKLK